MMPETMNNNSTSTSPSSVFTSTLHSAENVSIAKNLSLANYDNGGDDDADLLIILLPVIAVLCCVLAVLTIAWGLKRNRMEKLRQHLMPMYSLEASDSGQEWEVDLLSQEVRHGTDSNTTLSSPCLKFNSMHSEL